jgi:membrane protein required for colicin V production
MSLRMRRNCRLIRVSPVEPVDILMATILAIAVLRGFFLGLIREAFSIAAIGGACVAVKLFVRPVADWLQAASDGQIGALIAPWLAGAMLAVGTIAAIAIAGRLLRRGARLAGLGWADRAGGAVLGAAEGALAAAILLLIATSLLGRGHSALAQTHSLAAFEQLEQIVQGQGPRGVDVAAPPRR